MRGQKHRLVRGLANLGAALAAVVVLLQMAPAQAQTATLTLSPSTVAPGGTLTVTGTGFTPSESVTLTTSDGYTLGTVTADTAGNVSQAITVPSTIPAGTKTVTARGLTSGRTGVATLAISGTGIGVGTGGLTLTPSTVAPGGTLTVTGTGFTPSESVTLTTSDGYTLGTVTADTAGNVSQAITVPSTIPAGTKTVTARGLTSGRTATATLAISGTGVGVGGGVITVTPSTLAPGQAGTLTASGFSPSETVAFTTSDGYTLGTGTSDANGNVSQTFTLPGNITGGTKSVVARGLTSGRTASGTLVVSGTTVPTVVSSPTGGITLPATVGTSPPAAATASPGATSDIPVTGSNSRRLALFALAIGLYGLVLLSVRTSGMRLHRRLRWAHRRAG